MAQTQQQSLISVSVDGQPLPGLWDTLAGGETTADNQKRRSGGMPGRMKSFAALADHGDVTIGRDFERSRGDRALMKRMRKRSGKAFATVTETLLDDDGVPADSDPEVFICRLTGANPGEIDSESGDPRMVELTLQVVDIQ